jgi:pSer/pThr/pTyr-binding forkhead associated (FHA) protein
MQLVVTRGIHQGKFVPVDAKVFTIGRDKSCSLQPRSDEVSRLHAELKLISDIVLLRDLGSRNGTWVNGARLTTQVCLRHGDRIEIGPLAFTALIEETRQSEPRPVEDDVATWLIGDEENANAEQAEVPIGETAESIVGAKTLDRGGEDAASGPAEAKEPVDNAFDLLVSMSVKGPGGFPA